MRRETLFPPPPLPLPPAMSVDISNLITKLALTVDFSGYEEWAHSIEGLSLIWGIQPVLLGVEREPFRRGVDPENPKDRGVVYPASEVAGVHRPRSNARAPNQPTWNADMQAQWTDWQQRENRARGLLMMTVKPDILAQIKHLWSAYHMWLAIGKIFSRAYKKKLTYGPVTAPAALVLPSAARHQHHHHHDSDAERTLRRAVSFAVVQVPTQNGGMALVPAEGFPYAVAAPMQQQQTPLQHQSQLQAPFAPSPTTTPSPQPTATPTRPTSAMSGTASVGSPEIHHHQHEQHQPTTTPPGEAAAGGPTWSPLSSPASSAASSMPTVDNTPTHSPSHSPKATFVPLNDDGAAPAAAAAGRFKGFRNFGWI
ncbi:uncharacterized protein LOC62_02G002916 [Vanrija pseudolonga]|uniref:Uncharacterized protein n=1 Tax=Vanrija pseudolonga TaxID=143232 RepID=A0AAF1BPH0_9TREE|nr:hypothetical protein LOC62_02G002916 [Vanrija pseudolonga]